MHIYIKINNNALNKKKILYIIGKKSKHNYKISFSNSSLIFIKIKY